MLVSGFWPISLTNVCSRLSRVLAVWLVPILADIIGREQCTFLPTRSASDNI